MLKKLKQVSIVTGTLLLVGLSTTFANPVDNSKEINQTKIIQNKVIQQDTSKKVTPKEATKEVPKETIKEVSKDVNKNTTVKDTNNIKDTNSIKDANVKDNSIKNTSIKNTNIKDTNIKETNVIKETPKSVEEPVKLTYNNGKENLASYKEITQPTVVKDNAAEVAQQEMNKRHSVLQNVLPAALAVGAVYVGQHNWGDIQNKVGVDRVAHFACSYIINDQLQRTFKMSPFMATLTTIAIGAAKEKWIDNKWDNGDFAADCLGAFVADIRF